MPADFKLLAVALAFVAAAFQARAAATAIGSGWAWLLGRAVAAIRSGWAWLLGRAVAACGWALARATMATTIRASHKLTARICSSGVPWYKLLR